MPVSKAPDHPRGSLQFERDMTPTATPESFGRASARLTIGSIDDSRLTVTAQFNPRELAVSTPHQWTAPTSIGKHSDDATTHEYKGQGPETMSLELLFDAVESPNYCIDDRSIVGLVGDLQLMAAVRTPGSPDEDLGRPHHCVVLFGSGVMAFPKFECVIDQIDVKYQMFSRDGQVTRATITLKLRQVRRRGAREWFR